MSNHFRMGGWALTALVLLIILLLGLGRWQELPILIWKLDVVTVAAWLGYWIDRTLFGYARPHTFLPAAGANPWLFIGAQIRRALIMLAVILAVALAL